MLELTSQNDTNWMERQGCKSLSDLALLCDRNITEKIEQSALEEGITVKILSRDLGKEIEEEAQTSNDRKEDFKH